MKNLANSSLSKREEKNQVFDGLKYFWRLLKTGNLKVLSSSAKVVILILAWHSGCKLVSYPSISRLVHESGLNRKTVQRALQELALKGFIEIHRLSWAEAKRWTGTKRKVFYKLIFPDHVVPEKRQKNKPPLKTKMVPDLKTKMVPDFGTELVFKQTYKWTDIEQTDLNAPAKGSGINLKVHDDGNGRDSDDYLSVKGFRTLNEKEWRELRKKAGI